MKTIIRNVMFTALLLSIGAANVFAATRHGGGGGRGNGWGFGRVIFHALQQLFNLLP